MIQTKEEQDFILAWNSVAHVAYTTAKAHGFHDKSVNTDVGRLMLIVCEVAEAVEALRHGNPRSKKIPLFSHLEEEIADVVIRVMDFGVAYGGIRLADAIVAKMRYNSTRLHMHGKTM